MRHRYSIALDPEYGTRVAYLLRSLVHHDMGRITANAWKVVSAIAVEQLRKHTQTEQPQPFSLRQLTERTGLSKASIARAIHEAVGLGVLDHERGLGRQSSSYRIVWPAERGAYVTRSGQVATVATVPPPPSSSPAVQAFTNLSDLAAVHAFLSRLRSRGPAGELAALLFQAQRSSSEAKTWRPGGSGSRRRYAIKAEALAAVTQALNTHAGALGITWGWARDADVIRREALLRRGKLGPDDFENRGPAGPTWILYADLPCGQVSFHTWQRGVGPDYLRKWDGVRGASVERILQYCDTVV